MGNKKHFNPFRVGTEIREPADFAGREEILEKVSENMISLQNVSLHGERRTGKTSLLLYLSHPRSSSTLELPPTSVPVYVNFQGLAQASTTTVWQAITDAIAEQVEQKLPDKKSEIKQFSTAIAKFSEVPELFVTGLGQALAPLKEADLKIHLLFDEFEQTAQNRNLGDPFYDALRSLPTRTGNISYVIATRTGLATLQPEYDKISSPFFNIFTTLTLHPFEEDEVRHLIFDYFARADLDFSLAEKLLAQRESLYETTGYHPFFIQDLCYHLCERLDHPDWPVGQAQQEALRAFEKDSEPHFEYYWEISSLEEQELIGKLAARQPIPERAVRGLYDRCLAIETARGWQLFSSAFERWVGEQQPQVTGELSRAINADLDKVLAAYQEAGAEQWEDRINSVRRKLARSPSLLEPRLRLGEVLMRIGRTDEAVLELERAYSLDPSKARSPLTQALVAQARAREQAGDDDAALRAAARAIEISPGGKTAQNIREDIWIRRGDAAMESGTLDEALVAYRQAGAKNWSDALPFVQRELERNPDLLQTRLHLSQVLIQLGNNDAAVTELERAYEIDPEKTAPSLVQALMVQARSAHEDRDWVSVQDLCVRVLRVDCNQPDAIKMIAEAAGELKRRITGKTGVEKQQLYNILSGARTRVRMLGVVALDADWEDLAEKWVGKCAENPDFAVTILCESDNLLFSKSFTSDTDAVKNRRSFQALKFIRDRAIIDLPETLQKLTEDTSNFAVEIMYLPIPISIIQVDDRVFANLWLHESGNRFEEIDQNHPWHSLVEEYTDVYFDPKLGRKFACGPGGELLELFDHNRIPRGIYPRASFYDTDYLQLVVWAFVFDRQGRLLIHRRDNNAKDNQGMWDKSVGGHTRLTDADTSRTVPREVMEELFSEEIRESKADFAARSIIERDMVYLGEWRPELRHRHPFREISEFKGEWAFFRLPESESRLSLRTLPDGTERRLRVTADVFLFIADPKLTDKSLGELMNSKFKLIELAELKNALDKAMGGRQVPGFDEEQPVPKFTPDLKDIMTGKLRDTLEEFSQYIKTQIKR